jgi:hypothetical protein
MFTRILKQVFMPVLLLALLWPTPAGYYVRLGVAGFVAAIWALQASRSRYHRQAAYATASPKAKYEN